MYVPVSVCAYFYFPLLPIILGESSWVFGDGSGGGGEFGVSKCRILLLAVTL